MANFSFGTFLVDSSNRAAFETAQAVADLRLPDPAPILLLGDSGCGKTHLMRSIVGRVRAATRHVGLAFITARHFPDAARLLIDDPSPVQRAAGAILLVDQLEEFTGLVDELEVVTRIFLDNGHAVVFASHLHPGRLQNLTPGLKEILDAARVVSIEPQSSETRVELLKRQFREESGDVIRRQSLEIEELRREVDRLQRMGAAEQPHEHLELERAHGRELDRRLEALEAENARLEAELQHDRTAQGMAQDAERLEGELDRARAEADLLRTQVSSLHEAVDELEALQSKLEALEQEHGLLRNQAALAETLEREVRTLQDQLRDAWAKSAHAADLEDTIEALRQQVDEDAAAIIERDTLREALAQSENDARRAREEANTLLGRAESLLELVESNRSRFREVEAQRTAQIAELQAQLEHEREQALPVADLLAVKRQAEEALAQLGSERESFQETQRSLEQTCADALATSRQLEEERDRLLEEQARAENEVRAAREVREAALKELDQVRPANAHLKEENSALRQELLDLNSRREETQQALYDAQSQRDEALAEAGRLRDTLEGLEAELEGERAANAGLQGQFADKARELGSLAAALNAMAAQPPPEEETLAEAGMKDDWHAAPAHVGESVDGGPTAIEFVAAEPLEEVDDPPVDDTPALEAEAPPEAEAEPHAHHDNGAGWEAHPTTLAPETNGTHGEPAAPERVADSLEPLQDLSPLDDERDASI